MSFHPSNRNFTASDVLQHSAELSLHVEAADISPSMMETPLFAGRMLIREVQPGLTITASDITYLIDEEVVMNIDTSLSCGILLEGPPEEMLINERHCVRKRLNSPVLVGYGARSACRWLPSSSRRTVGAGFMIKPVFFDRFADDVSDDGLASLRNFLAHGFRTETLPRSLSLAERAKLNLNHPYNGLLAELFLESNALFLMTEVADQLKRQHRVVTAIGKHHYNRVMEAREILDSNLVAPPATLKLARSVGVNITTLQANFKIVFDTTIFGYVRRQRLAMGRILLMEHGLSVAEAGKKVGFSSPSAFAAAYRRQFGHAPTAVRPTVE
ncbi:MAG: AraC family transcriptional regulator [Rhizobium sp.]